MIYQIERSQLINLTNFNFKVKIRDCLLCHHQSTTFWSLCSFLTTYYYYNLLPTTTHFLKEYKLETYFINFFEADTAATSPNRSLLQSIILLSFSTPTWQLKLESECVPVFGGAFSLRGMEGVVFVGQIFPIGPFPVLIGGAKQSSQRSIGQNFRYKTSPRGMVSLQTVTSCT